MTKEEIQYEAQSIIQEWGSNDSAPYVEFVEKLASMELPESPSSLDEAAKECAIREGYLAGLHHEIMKRVFKAGAEWMAGQFVLVGGEPTGWFRANDGGEYATGLDLKEPIKLPVDFYVRKK